MIRIMVIEDDKQLRENILELLKNENYETDCAENGLLGVEKVKKEIPDLIICDIMMPLMNGYEVLQELQKNTITAAIPFIFLTAKAEINDLRHGMKLGADDYLFKPFDMEELLATVESRLKKKEANQKPIKELQQNMSMKVHHDLRTPLMPILGYADMIDELKDVDQIKEMVKVIKQSGKLLHEKIEKILLYKDLCLIETGFKSYKTKDVFTLINEDMIKNLYNNFSEKLKPEFRIDIDVEEYQLPIDNWFLPIILKELLENALKFSEVRQPVLVRGKIEEDSYVIQVKDYGKGLTSSEIKNISAFTKFGNNQIAESGLGLGLILVQKIVVLFNGTFTIISEPDVSTNIIIRLKILS